MKAKKTIQKKIEQELPKEEPKKYSVWLKINDTETSFETDDIGASLLDMKPPFIKTRMLFKAVKNGLSCDKILSGMQTRQIFRNKLAMMVFLNRLIFK